MVKGESHIPKLRFKGFSDVWHKTTFGKIADIKRGASPRPISDKKWFDDSSKVGWVRISDVTKSSYILNNTEQYLSAKGIEKSRLVKKDNLIMSICATIGKPIYTGFDVCIHDGFVVFDNLKSNLPYTIFYLQLIENQWVKYGQPGTQINLNSDIVSNEVITLPNLPEQTQIGNFFQKIDQVIELQQKALDTARDYKKSMLQKMFPQKGEKVPQIRFDGFSGDWEECKFSKIYSFVRNGFVGIATPHYVEKGVVYIQGRNIKSGKLLNNGYVNITTAFHESKPNSTLKENDLLMVQSGHVGECAVVTDEFSGANCHAILIASPKDNKTCNSLFYLNYFSSDVGVKKIHMITTGNTVKHILSSDLKEILVPKISLEEQQKIGEFFQKLDQQIEQHEKKLESYQNLKKAMLQRLFV